MTRKEFEKLLERKYKLDPNDFVWDSTRIRYSDPVISMLWDIYHEGKKHFVTKKSPKFIISRQASKGVYVFSSNPRWHSDEKQAIREAERLAEKTGGRFIIFSSYRTINVASKCIAAT